MKKPAERKRASLRICFQVTQQEFVHLVFALPHCCKSPAFPLEPPSPGSLALVHKGKYPSTNQCIVGSPIPVAFRMYLCNKFWTFSPVNPSHGNLIISPARRTQKVGGKLLFVPPQLVPPKAGRGRRLLPQSLQREQPY